MEPTTRCSVRVRLLVFTDQVRCCEHNRAPRLFTCGDAQLAQVVGDEPVAESRVASVDVVGGVDQVRVVPVAPTHRVLAPGVEGLFGKSSTRQVTATGTFTAASSRKQR